jgi:MYXO-CTERM domain-containing protein
MSDRRDIDVPDDPSGIEEPHDVLAAEEFAMPTRSAGDVQVDPSGIQQPHDVLAAEEFAMPTAGVDHDNDGLIDPRSLIPGALLLLLLLLLLRRRRRRRASAVEV